MFTGRIKGINIGSWLIMEGYVLGGRNIPESEFKRYFKKENGEQELREFERSYRDNFIREEDFKNIVLMGANTIRLPFNYRLIETKPFVYSEEGFSYLDKALSWAKKYRLGVILDLHAACGAQNCDWHGDSDGKAHLWENAELRERTCALWGKIADRYKSSPALIGYDVLNEPVIGKEQEDAVKRFYAKAVKKIRAIDKKHRIFLEGNLWATRIDFLSDLSDDGITISIHAYEPLSYTFNFSPFLKYPGTINAETWNTARIARYLAPYADFARKYKTRIFVGEFGINWRGGFWGEAKWLEAMLKAFDTGGFDYTYWTYKAVAGHAFPDGLYQFLPNNQFVRREGPVFGWENYITLWKKEKRHLIDFWKTGNFTPNQKIIAKLRQHFRG